MDMNIADAVRKIADDGCLDTLGVFRDWLGNQDGTERAEQLRRLDDAFGDLLQSQYVLRGFIEFARQLRVIFWKEIMTFDEAKAYLLQKVEEANRPPKSSASPSPFPGWQPPAEEKIVNFEAKDMDFETDINPATVLWQHDPTDALQPFTCPHCQTSGLSIGGKCPTCQSPHHGQCEE